MNRSLTQNAKLVPPCSMNELLSKQAIKESNILKANANEAARLAGFTMLGLAALSMGATGVIFPGQGDEAIAAVDPSFAVKPLTERAPEINLTQPGLNPEIVSQGQVGLKSASSVSVKGLDETGLGLPSYDAANLPSTDSASLPAPPLLIPESSLNNSKVNSEESKKPRPETLVTLPQSSSLTGTTAAKPAKDSVVVPGSLGNASQESEASIAVESENLPAVENSLPKSELQAPTPTFQNRVVEFENPILPSEAAINQGSTPKLITSPPVSNPSLARSSRPENSVLVPDTTIIPSEGIKKPEPAATNSVVVPSQVTSSNQAPSVSKDSVLIPGTIPTPGEPIAANTTGTTYQVQQGDTLDNIADRYGISRDALLENNQIRNPNHLEVNQELKIPKTPGVQPFVSQVPTLITSRPATASSTSENLLLAQVEPPALVAHSNSQVTHIERMADEIKRMREVHRTQATQTQATAPVAVMSAPSPVQEPKNPEWQRRQNSEQLANGNRLPQPRTLENQAPMSLSGVQQPTVARPSNAIATAPAPTSNFNRLLQLPSGQSVAPQLPPLEQRDQYLPDGPMRFNGFIWPAKGTLTSGFGPRWGRMHRGIDIANATGTPIFAAASGEVISAGWNSGGFGNLVEIRHPDGSMTRYAHNSRVLVRKGQQVQQGEQISLMGSTGFSTGPHLHFEYHPAGKGAINPIAFLPRERN